MTPTISVVIPLYNRPELIKNVVDSVLAQTLPADEVLLINDGSIDDVEGEVRKNIAESALWHKRVRLISQENQGQSAALNNGIAHAKGDWIAFNANDDLWLPQKLELQFKALEKHGPEYGLCFTDAWFMNNPHMKSLTLFEFAKTNFSEPNGTLDDPVRLLLHKNPIWCQTVVVRTDLVRQVGGYDAQMRFSEDYDFIFRLSMKTNFCYVGLPMVVIDRSISPTRHKGAGLNWQKKEFKLLMDERRIERQLKLTKGMDPKLKRAAQDNMRAHYSKWTNLYLKNGDYSKAREAVAVAAKYNLTLGIAIKWMLVQVVPGLARRIVLRREADDTSERFGLNL